jgi:Predicted metal-dependent hydrolase
MQGRNPAPDGALIRGDRIEVGGLSAFLVRSRRRTVSLQVNPDLSLLLKAPFEVPEEELRDFLQRRSRWALRHIERMERIKSAAPDWRDGGRVPFLGRECRIVASRGSRSRARFVEASLPEGGLFARADAYRRGELELDGDSADIEGRLVVAVTLADPNDREALRGAIERLYAREAAARLPPMLASCLERAEPRIGRVKPELRVRTMRSRWGSCDAAKAVVTLNARLLRYRPEVIEGVIMHELAHFKYHSHGPRFYGLLAALCPDYEELQAQLAEAYLD